MRAWRGPERELGRALARMSRTCRGRSGVLALARAHCRRNPGASLSNHVDVRCLRLVGWPEPLGLVEILDAAPDDDQCTDEAAKHDGVQHGDGRRVGDVADAEYQAWRRC